MSHRQISVLSLGLLLIFTGSGNTVKPPTPGDQDTPLSVIEAQIRKDVFSALQKNQMATSYEEWANSGFTPRDIFENVRSLQDSSKWQYLCGSLSLLGAEDLGLFQNSIEESKELPCKAELAQKLQNYWSASQVALSQERTLDLMSKGRGLVDSSEEPIVELPSIEKHIDAAAGQTFSRGELKDGEIAFTFDDGPHPTRTQNVLGILEQAKVRAVFFELGGNAKTYPEISKLLATRGQIVASHTYGHPQLTKLTLDRASQEIDRGRQEVSIAAGVDIPFFRFPYGARNRVLTELVKSKGMASFLWNMDTLDWKIRNPSALFENVMKELNREKGGIILFHDVHQQTVIVLPHLLKELRARNFSTVVFVPH